MAPGYYGETMDEMSMSDYGSWKPGLYLQVGGNVKALDLSRGSDDSWAALLGLDRRVNKNTLTDKEPWTFTSLNRRAEWLNNVPYAWVVNDNDADIAPFSLNMRDMLPQIDKALQTREHGAFLYKWRLFGKRFELKWLNPDTIEPDVKTATLEKGITRFERTKDKGQTEWLPAEDIIWFKRPGMKELESDPSPLEASRLAAEVLYNISQMEDWLYETNGLPVMLIMVPAVMNETERTRLEATFDRIMNRMGNAREMKTTAVREGVDVKILSFSPNQMDLGATVERHRAAVLSVHAVPMSVAMSNAANFATATSDQIQFANTMAGRLEAIAETFNNDKDVAASGYSLDVRRNELPTNQEEEAARADAFSKLVMGGIHPEAALAMLGFDLPENYEGPLLADMPVDGEQYGSGGLVTQERVLNGAQIASAIDIVQNYNVGQIPRENAIFMISTFFNLPRDIAEAMLPNSPQGSQQPEPIAQPIIDDIPEDEPMKSMLWHDDAKRFKSWLKNRDTPDINDFNSNELSYKDKLDIVAEISDATIYDWRNYP